MNYDKITPCDNCPFRTDIPGYLSEVRIWDIAKGLIRGDFACHKTTVHDDDGDTRATTKSQHCAGALIMLEKMEQHSQLMRIAERLRIYDRTKLNMDAPVFDCFEDMADAQPS